MKLYLSYFRINFTNTLQYRIAAISGSLTQFMWGFLLIMMYRAFYIENPSSFPMEFEALASYIWLQQASIAMFMFWALEEDTLNSIETGSIAYELSRPVDLYKLWFTRSISFRLSRMMLRAIPIVILTSLIPKPYKLGLPASPLAFLLFIITLALSIILTVSLTMFIYISIFYTKSSTGIRILTASLLEFLSGHIIPFPFLPDKLRGILEILPFGSAQDIPFRIYSGDLSFYEITYRVAFQVLWTALALILGKMLMRNAIKRVEIQGG